MFDDPDRYIPKGQKGSNLKTLFWGGGGVEGFG